MRQEMPQRLLAWIIHNVEEYRLTPPSRRLSPRAYAAIQATVAEGWLSHYANYDAKCQPGIKVDISSTVLISQLIRMRIET